MNIKGIKEFFTELIKHEGFCRFFISSRGIDRVELEDLLLKRYNNIDYVLKMPLKRSIELVKKARYEERREII